MQFKKKHIRERILKKAEDLLIEKGYSNTYMKDIAKSAGIGVSSIYTYFQSKAALFEQLVGETYENIKSLIDYFMSEEVWLDPASWTGKNEKNSYFNTIVDLLYDNKKASILLFKRAEGTRFENFYEELLLSISKERNTMGEIVEEVSGRYLKREFPWHISDLLFKSLFDSLLNDIENELTKEEAKARIVEVIYFYMNGFKGYIKSDI